MLTQRYWIYWRKTVLKIKTGHHLSPSEINYLVVPLGGPCIGTTGVES